MVDLLRAADCRRAALLASLIDSSFQLKLNRRLRRAMNLVWTGL